MAPTSVIRGASVFAIASGIAISAIWGWAPAICFMLGFLGMVCHLVGLWFLISLIGSSAQSASGLPPNILARGAQMLILIPMVFIFMPLAQRLGRVGQFGFAGGFAFATLIGVVFLVAKTREA